MRSFYLLLLVAILMFTGGNSLNAQSRTHNDSERYIQKYSDIAVEQMKKYGIPASITLAQGLLESGAGKSKLATKANNHFGIKADSRWKGKTFTSFDNGNWHKFRAYKNAEKSYDDHSLFLVGNSRYASLFKLSRKDYKGWAKGLKRAYYAEDREYDKKLIGLIEKYELHKYDSNTLFNTRKNKTRTQTENSQFGVQKANGLLYTRADTGDTFKTLSKRTGVSRRKLRKYNDLYKGYVFQKGDIVYLEKKNRKAVKGYEFHTTKSGESLYKISQMYGIKLKSLYNLNPQYESYTTLKVGDVVRLR